MTSRTIAIDLVRTHLFRAPSPSTVAALRALSAALEAEGLGKLGPGERLALDSVRAYLRADGVAMTDREVGAWIKRQRRWHLVSYNAGQLVEWALSSPVGT